jgi:ornithine cyclodeaminase/alanine dehydrogenase
MGQTLAPVMMGIHYSDGGFHLKAGVLALTRHYFAAKVNANFPHNRERFSLPTIQGLIVLCDASNGRPLAVMDSMEITALRTAAATAVAAKRLARADSRVAIVCGCGSQGPIQMEALAQVLELQRVFTYDLSEERAAECASVLSAKLGIEVAATKDLQRALAESDVCVTCTSSRQAFLKHGHVQAGTFIAAVGADNPEKQELEPKLMASAKIVVDVLEQCASSGDLHHAIESGLVQRSDVYAELGEVVAGMKNGRTSAEETIIFDSTGMALQDVSAAASVFEKAKRSGAGTSLEFAA